MVVHIQSVLFERALGWDEDRARIWLRANGFVHVGEVIEQAGFYRFRQLPPDGFKHLFMTRHKIELGVSFCVGYIPLPVVITLDDEPDNEPYAIMDSS